MALHRINIPYLDLALLNREIRSRSRLEKKFPRQESDQGGGNHLPIAGNVIGGPLTLEFREDRGRARCSC